MTTDDRVKALADEKASKVPKFVPDNSWTEEQLQEAGIEFCPKHSKVSLKWTMLEVGQEEKPTKRVSFGLCEECEKGAWR